jgi:hypothetical protein
MTDALILTLMDHATVLKSVRPPPLYIRSSVTVAVAPGVDCSQVSVKYDVTFQVTCTVCVTSSATDDFGSGKSMLGMHKRGGQYGPSC